jgi:hypothetical protein
MATQTEQPKATDAPGYDEDFYLWSLSTAELIRSGRFDQVDRENVAEEIESLGKRDLRELNSRTITLLMHLLKRDHQPEKRSPSWSNTIDEQRSSIRLVIKDSPSLKRRLADLRDDLYEEAVARAMGQTGLDRQVFPAVCPYTTAEVFGDWVEK